MTRHGPKFSLIQKIFRLCKHEPLRPKHTFKPTWVFIRNSLCFFLWLEISFPPSPHQSSQFMKQKMPGAQALAEFFWIMFLVSHSFIGQSFLFPLSIFIYSKEVSIQAFQYSSLKHVSIYPYLLNKQGFSKGIPCARHSFFLHNLPTVLLIRIAKPNRESRDWCN